MQKMSPQFLEMVRLAINPKVRRASSPLHKDAVPAQRLQRRGSFSKVHDHVGFFLFAYIMHNNTNYFYNCPYYFNYK